MGSKKTAFRQTLDRSTTMSSALRGGIRDLPFAFSLHASISFLAMLSIVSDFVSTQVYYNPKDQVWAAIYDTPKAGRPTCPTFSNGTGAYLYHQVQYKKHFSSLLQQHTLVACIITTNGIQKASNTTTSIVIMIRPCVVHAEGRVTTPLFRYEAICFG